MGDHGPHGAISSANASLGDMNRLFAAALTLALAMSSAETEAKRVPPERLPTHRGTIAGTVRHESTGEIMSQAKVRLYCTCLQFVLETVTDERGAYRFVRLPPGAYTVDTQVDEALVGKRFRLPRNAKFRVNLWIDPAQDLPRLIDLEPAPEPKRFHPDEWVPKAVADKQRNRMPAAFRHLEYVEWSVPLRHYD